MGREPVKRWTVGLLTLVMLCFVAACGSQESGDISMPETYFSEAITETESADGADGQQVSEHHKILIAYFTWADNVENISEVAIRTVGGRLPFWWKGKKSIYGSFLSSTGMVANTRHN